MSLSISGVSCVHMPSDQRAACRSWGSPSTISFLETELKLLSLVTSIKMLSYLNILDLVLNASIFMRKHKSGWIYSSGKRVLV